MARVNLEEKFFGDPKVKRLKRLLNWDDYEVIGLLSLLWHGSQSVEKHIGTKQEIIEWGEIDLVRPEKIEEIFSALLSCKFIEDFGDGSFYISGNRDQIEGLRKHSKKGGGKNLTPERVEDSGPQDNPLKSQTLNRGSENCAAIQYNSIQDNAYQSSSKQCKTKQNRTEQVSNRKGSDSSSPSPSKKNGVPAIWKARITPDDKQLAKQWFDRANELTPKSKYSLEKFEEALCRIRFDYKFTSDHLVQIFEFIKEDDFWRHNVVSPTSLLKPSKSEPEITKLMQVVRSLKNKPKTEEELLEESFARRRAKEQQEANYFDEPIDVMGYSHD